VAANAAFDLITEGADADLLDEPVNAYRLALHPRGMGRRVANLGQWGRHVTESLQYQIGHQPDAGLERLLDELEGYLPDQPVTTDDAHLAFDATAELLHAIDDRGGRRPRGRIRPDRRRDRNKRSEGPDDLRIYRRKETHHGAASPDRSVGTGGRATARWPSR
jgi:hypothetical protein